MAEQLSQHKDNKIIQRILISVYDKQGLDKLCQALKANPHVEVVSTGSTAQTLRDRGVVVTDVSAVTGFPESLDGRVKTLDPHIHAGILADMNQEKHVDELHKLDILPFDAVVVNLYPFAQTVLNDSSIEEIVEKIDIGGPTMVRAAAKNSLNVAVITDRKDYDLLAERIEQSRGFSLEERRWLATKAFAHTAHYDAIISQWTAQHWRQPESWQSEETLPENSTNISSTETESSAQTHKVKDSLPSSMTQLPSFTYTWDYEHALRYGENPHQEAALYVDPMRPHSLATAQLLGGKAMSYNNYVDADAAWRAVWDFPNDIAVAVCKHNNPCGIAIADTVEEAYMKAHSCDPVSAFGGIIAVNRKVTLAMAESIRPVFTEVIVAPDYEEEALELFRTKKKNLRIIKVHDKPAQSPQLKLIDGGALVQSYDALDVRGDDVDSWTLVAGNPADTDTLKDLQFAWRALRCVKSNAVLLARNLATVGIGMGQVNRVDSCHLCVERANTLAGEEKRAQGSVAASDAFFPFADGPQYLIDAGVKAIVQPGGSIRDEEVFEAARRAGITMYTTGTRHFLH